MSLKRRKILKQMLDLGHGTQTIPADSGGTLTGDKIGLHTFMGWLNVKDFGASGDGTTDDTTAIQAAVTSLVDVGGTVFFPAGRYRITTTISVSSAKPICLRGDMMGMLHDPTTANVSAIILGATIAGPMIQYTAPSAAARGTTGGGRIEGLAFIDPANRTYTCTAVLDLNDFPLSQVRNCIFQWIKGRAILGEFMVMSEISGNIIRYCGDTSKPAVDLPSTNLTYPSQSLLISGNRLEVNYGDTYLKIGTSANSNAIIVDGNRFEAETATADTNGQFLEFAALGGKIINNNFSRNTGKQVTLSGFYNVMTGNTFLGGAYATTAMVVSGDRNVITNNVFASTRTGIEVSLTGTANMLNSNKFYFCGSVKTAAVVSNSICNNSFERLTATTANLGAGFDFWIYAAGTGGETINGNTMDNSTPNVTTTGAIKLAGSAAVQVCVGNNIRTFTGSGNGLVGIEVANNGAVVGDNGLLDATLVTTNTGGAFSNNYVSGLTLPLQGSTAWNPGNILAGATSVKTVTVTGAGLGDFAEASLTTGDSALIMSVLAAVDSVAVTLYNPTAGTINVASGTLYARVKKW